MPLYVAELSPKQIRGRLVTSNQLFICIGVLYGFVADNAFKCPDNGDFCTTLETPNWKWMLFWCVEYARLRSRLRLSDTATGKAPWLTLILIPCTAACRLPSLCSLAFSFSRPRRLAFCVSAAGATRPSKCCSPFARATKWQQRCWK